MNRRDADSSIDHHTAAQDQVLWFTFCWLHNVYATGVLSVR